MRIKFRNIILVIKDQMPLKRFIRNFFITRNAWGLFYRSSHVANYSGKEKICYPTSESAIRAALRMEKKNPDKKFSGYKCLHCDFYHIGGRRS